MKKFLSLLMLSYSFCFAAQTVTVERYEATEEDKKQQGAFAGDQMIVNILGRLTERFVFSGHGFPSAQLQKYAYLVKNGISIDFRSLAQDNGLFVAKKDHKVVGYLAAMAGLDEFGSRVKKALEQAIPALGNFGYCILAEMFVSPDVQQKSFDVYKGLYAQFCADLNPSMVVTLIDSPNKVGIQILTSIGFQRLGQVSVSLNGMGGDIAWREVYVHCRNTEKVIRGGVALENKDSKQSSPGHVESHESSLEGTFEGLSIDDVSRVIEVTAGWGNGKAAGSAKQ